MEKKDYFIFKYRNPEGYEFWDAVLYSTFELADSITHSLSMNLTVVGIKHIVLE